MGRWTAGDLEYKFMFGVQASDDADHFGVTGVEPEDKDMGGLDYTFEKEHLPEINKGIKLCIKELGRYRKLLDKFFENNEGFNEEMIAISLKIPISEVRTLLEQYARYELGVKIRDCVKKKGHCYFWAEC